MLQPNGTDHNHHQSCHNTAHAKCNTRKLLLLDSCSTVCIIANKNLLHNIHRMGRTMTVQCNAGTRQTNRMGWIGDFPEPVWYDLGGVANIMSLQVVMHYYDMIYDSRNGNVFRVTSRKDGRQQMVFKPTPRGLFARAGLSNAWTFVNMVARQKDNLSHRANKNAALARRIQNIIMYPGVQGYAKIVDHNFLRNCPVTRTDILNAERIYSPNVNALKGKTTRQSSVRIVGHVDPVPPEILGTHQDVILEIDIMFVNRLAFLVTISRKIHFGTVEPIKNRQTGTVARGVKHVIDIYLPYAYR